MLENVEMLSKSLIYLIFFFGISSQSKEKIDPAFEVPKNHFFSFLKKESLANFCDHKGYFRTCFDITNSSCDEDVVAQIDECKKNLKIPDSFDVIDISTHSQNIGECVGKGLETKWTERKKGTRECAKRL